MLFLGIEVKLIALQRLRLSRDATQLAERFASLLPLKDMIEIEFDRYLKSTSYTGEVKVSAKLDEVFVTLKEPVPIPLFRYLSQKSNASSDNADPFTVQSSHSSKLSPRQAMIFVDTGTSLAPKIGEDNVYGALKNIGTYSRWFYQPLPSGTLPLWGTSPYFDKFLNHTCQGKICSPTDSVILAQHCFNPIFSSIKEGAYLLFEELKLNGNNRVGLYFGPSKGKELESVQGFNESPKSTFSIESLSGGNSPSHLDCLAAAEEAYYTPTFGLRDWRKLSGSANSLSGGHFRQMGFPKSYTTSISDEVPLTNQTFPPLLFDTAIPLKKVLWTLPAHNSRRFNMEVAVNEIYAELASTIFNDDTKRVPVLVFMLLGNYPTSTKGLFFSNQIFGRSISDDSRERLCGDFEDDDKECTVKHPPYEQGLAPNPPAVSAITNALRRVRDLARSKGIKVWLFILVARHDQLDGECTTLPDNRHWEVCPKVYGTQLHFRRELLKVTGPESPLRIFPLLMPDPAAFAYEMPTLLSLLGRKVVVE
jgi:hypothetical protein